MSANDTEIYYGIRLGGLFGIEYYDFRDDNRTIESVFESLNNAHTGFFYAYFCIVLIIASLIHFFRKRYVKSRPLRLKLQKFSNRGRAIRSFFLKQGWFGLPTRAHTVIVICYVIINIWVCLFSSKPTLQLIQLARKAGWFSVVNGTLLVFLAMKNTPLSYLTGMSYEKLNVFHRWVAITALIQGGVHTIAVAVGLSRLIPSQVGFLLVPANVWGIVTLALWMIILASFYLLKVIRYEVFYVLHLVLFPLTFIACILHNHFSYGPIGAAFILYFIDRCIRYNRIFWHNRYSDKLKAKVQFTQDEMTIVKVPRGNLMWRPGTHAFLCMPGIRYFESHPFTIASVGDDIDTEGGKKTVDFIIKAEDGFTKEMQEEAKKLATDTTGEIRELRAILDGPYGALPNFNDYDNLLLYASGSGITFILPIALSAVRKARVRHLEFIWSTKRAMSYENIRPQLEELARGGHGPNGQSTYVVIRLHETAPDKKSTRGFTMSRMRTMMASGPRSHFLRGRSTDRGEDESSTLISGRESTDTPPVPAIPQALQSRTGHARSYSGDIMPSSTGYGATSDSDPSGPPSQPRSGVSMAKRQSGYFKAPTSDDHTILEEEDYASHPRRSSDIFAGMSDDDPDPDDSADERTISGRRGIDDYSDDDSDPDNEKSRALTGGAHQDVRDALDKFIYEGRPKMEEIIPNFVGSCGPDETCAVAACGPGSDKVRLQAAKAIKKGGPSVSLFVEEFGW
ncbi:uncharacterized protein DFL_003418 [Arthrobotrys flagrans]|uniref:ferric-chelate reductase (NADPH) n=1 Tax=Arthrobotrys flagrans TaxID=97331 RepID=A0A437A1T8_ARTFL|nr:hypothetical protein DFL_003418 [Arthrobotrys flagrans]